MGSEEGKKTLLCVDGLNWLSLFWDYEADLQHIEDPWAALRNSDEKVNKFVNGARSADYELAIVVTGGAKDPEVRATYESRREHEILHGKKGVCLGADLFLAESFRSRTIPVVKPIGADTNDVIAAFANSFPGAIVVSRNNSFCNYDKPLLVYRNFTVKKGRLLLAEPREQFNKMGKPIQPALAVYDETWCGGHENKYRPSLRSRIEFGCSSSSDRKMGNLHSIARPLRAAVYSILGEESAVERIPEWSNDQKMVVWTETTVAADDTLVSVVQNPIAAVEWLVDHDTIKEEMEPWKATERHFNICCLSADLVTAASKGDWTMHKCMELFSKEPEIVKRTTVDSSQATPSSTQDARARLPPAPKPPMTPKLPSPAETGTSTTPPLPAETGASTTPKLPSSAENVASPSSTARPSNFGAGRPHEEVKLPIFGSGRLREEVRSSIFGTGRPREEVLKERSLWR